MMEQMTHQSKPVLDRFHDQEIDLQTLLHLIKHGYKIILFFVFTFLIGGVFYAKTRPLIYESSAILEIEKSGISNSGVNILAISGMQYSSADVETALLKSPYILSDVVRQLNMDVSISPKHIGFFERIFKKNKKDSFNINIKSFNVPNQLLDTPLTLVIQNATQYQLIAPNGKRILQGNVGQPASGFFESQPVTIQISTIQGAPGSQFIITKHPAVSIASDIANNLSITEKVVGTGVLTLTYLSSNAEQAQKILNMILMIAVEKNIKQKSEEASKILMFLAAQLPDVKNKLDKAEMKLGQFDLKLGMMNATFKTKTLVDNISNLEQTLKKLTFERARLSQKFTPSHPAMITEAKKEADIKKQLYAERLELKKLPAISWREADLKRNLLIQQEIYTAILKNSQQMKMLEAGTVGDVRILSSASYPVFSIPVNKKEIILGAVVFGLMISLGIIFLQFILSPIVNDPDTVEQIIQLPVTAIIPFSQKQLNYNKTQKKNHRTQREFLLTREYPNDLSIEGLRSLRTAIQLLLTENKENVIAFTGCSPSAGKSFVSCNIALLMADIGKRTLLIDSDIRRGKLSKSYGLSKNPGLSTFLQGDVAQSEIIQTVIPNKLDFIATGLYPNNPAELFSNQKFDQLIQSMKNQYDLVIIDSPPILAVTDPALILKSSNINFMVLALGKDHIKEVQHAKNIFEKAGVKLTGLVFNCVNQYKFGHGYNYGKYNYYYAYDK